MSKNDQLFNGQSSAIHGKGYEIGEDYDGFTISGICRLGWGNSRLLRSHRPVLNNSRVEPGTTARAGDILKFEHVLF